MLVLRLDLGFCCDGVYEVLTKVDVCVWVDMQLEWLHRHDGIQTPL